ncbi:hypothetical protein R3P38DRAFT_2377681, partial [Favolaschia claudopus]
PIYLGSDDCNTKEQKQAKSDLQAFVTKRFRKHVGVPTNTKWPDPASHRMNATTGEVYPTPIFAADVKHAENDEIIRAVAHQAFSDLQNSKNVPTTVLAVNGTFDLALLQQMAKSSFRNLKPDWKKQNNEEAKARDELKKRNNRWLHRRQTKVAQLSKALPQFCADHELDPAPIEKMLCEEHMSDEASGPDSEDDSYESTGEWKRTMARLSGFESVTAAALKSKEFVEVIAPDWREDQMSDLFHVLHQRWASSNFNDTRRVFYIRVRNTSRKCRRIPALAPYDIGTSLEWLATARLDSNNVGLLHDWGTHGNPDGLDIDALKRAVTRELGR